jgi:hypothetical protein
VSPSGFDFASAISSLTVRAGTLLLTTNTSGFEAVIEMNVKSFRES